MSRYRSCAAQPQASIDRISLGSIFTSLSNSAGALANTYTYDSFWQADWLPRGSITNPFQYTGREFDPETGLYSYRFRYYDPTVGRFLSEDPIMFAGGIDLYRYADGNPISEVDPLGLDTKVCYYPSDNQPWGHVGFGLPQEGEQGTSGFYPDSWNVLDGPGKVKPDTKHKPLQCKTIHLRHTIRTNACLNVAKSGSTIRETTKR